MTRSRASTTRSARRSGVETEQRELTVAFTAAGALLLLLGGALSTLWFGRHPVTHEALSHERREEVMDMDATTSRSGSRSLLAVVAALVAAAAVWAAVGLASGGGSSSSSESATSGGEPAVYIQAQDDAAQAAGDDCPKDGGPRGGSGQDDGSGSDGTDGDSGSNGTSAGDL